ncbi:MAG: glycosyltransferase family 39 protein [Phycisphaerales bacterium]|nr:glycosyltransferase family 39 protein [Phycisphaerales bacterium]
MSQRPADYSRDLRLPRPPSTPMPLRYVILAMLAVCAPLVIASQIAAHLRFDVVDDQMFGYYGWRIAHGGVAYLDVWDNKPPGIYWINAIGFLIGGDSYGGVVFLCALAVIATLVLLYLIQASIYFRGAAAVSTVLACFFITHGFYQGGTNRTETFLIPFELGAVLLYFRGFVRDRWWKWYVAGLLCGVAFTFKQVGLAAWGAMGLHTIILVCIRELPVLTGLRRCLLLLAGAVTTIGAAAAYLHSQGALFEERGALFAIFGFNQAYFDVGASSMTEVRFKWTMLRHHMMPILTLPLLMAIAATIHSTLWFLRPQYRPVEIEHPLREFKPACPHYMMLFAIWYVAAMYGASVSPHAFRHYLLPTLPPLLLAGGYLINVIKTEVNLIDRLQQRAWVTAAFVLMGYLAIDAVWFHMGEVGRVWVDRFERKKDAPWETVGDAVAAMTRPDERIQCFGYQPGVYLRARRLNVCRYTTTEKMGQVQEGARFQEEELQRTLSATPPTVLGITAGDFGRLIDRDPNDTPMTGWDYWLRDFIATRYEHAQMINVEDDNYLLFKLRPAASGPTTSASEPATGAPGLR